MHARLFTLVVLFVFSPSMAEEGMYPISDIARLNLQAKGLQMAPNDLYNPNGISLIDGICKVNGCTGSFVSPKGLVITNHHCAYRAIQSASSEQNDYLKDGFQAKAYGEEIPAKGYTIRITESYKDISADVLSVVKPDMDFSARTKAITKRRKELEQAAEKANAGKRAEVAEMFTGKTYVLFVYTYVKDVRLVFAPPSSVGAFGGDIDNWEWPRHTGDFSFMRAYVAPDGSTADYSEKNVPYEPKRFIQVARQGVSEGDFVFLLGYPGRTARHKTASFLRYEENVRLPYVVDLYQWQINTMLADGKSDRSIALKHSNRSKGLANVEKRARGKLKGLKQKQLVAERAASEAKLQAYIEGDENRRAKYGSLMSDLDKVYADMTAKAPYEFNMSNLRSACRTLSFAFTIYDAAVERQKPDLERESPYMDRNFDQTKSRLMLGLKDLHVPTDKKMLAHMLERLTAVPDAKNVPALTDVLGDKAPAFVESTFAGTKLTDADFIEACLTRTPDELNATDDTFLKFIAALYPTYLELRESGKAREGELSQLYGSLIEAKMEFLKTNFVPDANATLRLTYGNIKGYSPADAIYKYPITTLKGVIEKTTGEDPFITPARIQELYKKRDFGNFVHPTLGEVPVGILYDTDTTGGNSGSPIFNARGELVGVNFDRAFEATINDFAWNKSYSRSLGVDVRYALWITGKVFGANHLLKEMGVN
jgi:hypothetical protein